MSKALPFKVFCIEQYKTEHRMKGAEVVRLFKQYGVLKYIGSCYDVLHSCGAKYIVQCIDEFIRVRQEKPEKRASRKTG